MVRYEWGDEPSTVEEIRTGECVIGSDASHTAHGKKLVLALLSSLSVPYEMKTIPTGFSTTTM